MSDEMRPRHEDIVDELGAYLIGGLEAEETRVVRRHLEECAECREILGELDGMNELLEAATLSEPPPDGLRERIIASVEGLAAAQRAETSAAMEAAAAGRVSAIGDAPSKRGVTFSLSAFATAAVLFFVLGIGISMIFRGFGAEGPATTESTATPTPAGTRLPPLKLLASSTPLTETSLPSSPKPSATSSSPSTTRTATPTNYVATPAGREAGGELTPTTLEGIWECDLMVWGLHPGQLYEVWFRSDQGWVSAGTFRVASPEIKVFRMTTGARSRAVTQVIITAEEDDGDPSPSPTVILAGSFTNR